MTTGSSGEWLLLATGRHGSLASALPAEVVGLESRLESGDDEKAAEIARLMCAGRGGRSAGARIALIHCAALTSVSECESDPERARRLNVEGALSWLAAAEASGVERFIYVSTSHVYLPPADRLPLDISAPVGPVSVYARTKLEAENALRARSLRTKVSVVRIFSLLSDHIRPGFLQHSLTQRAQKQDYSPIPGFHLTRDFVDAKDACATLVRLARSRDFPPLVNLCSGVPTTVGELARRIFAQCGLDPERLTGAPPRSTDIAYLVGVPTEFA